MELSENRKEEIKAEEQYRESMGGKNQKYGVPAVLSFLIPGLGQMVKGQVGRGIAILLGWFFSLILILTIIGAIVPAIIYFWQIYDAYNKPANK